MSEVYVYYKLRAGDAAAAQAAFTAARGEAPVRLLQRNEGGELLTWMEIYPPDLMEIEGLIAVALRPFIIGERHPERFSPLA